MPAVAVSQLPRSLVRSSFLTATVALSLAVGCAKAELRGTGPSDDTGDVGDSSPWEPCPTPYGDAASWLMMAVASVSSETWRCWSTASKPGGRSSSKRS
jgi:hypothetical protein